MLQRFLRTKARSSQLGAADPLAKGAAEPQKNPIKDSRIGKYKDARDRVDADTTSRLRFVVSSTRRIVADIVSTAHISLLGSFRRGSASVPRQSSPRTIRLTQVVRQGSAAGYRKSLGAISIPMCLRCIRGYRWEDRSWRNTQTSHGRLMKSTSRPGRKGARVYPSLTRVCVKRTRWGGCIIVSA